MSKRGWIWTAPVDDVLSALAGDIETHGVQWLSYRTSSVAQCLRERIIPENAALRQQLADAQAQNAKLRDAATELLGVADMRGDSTLPHPADDPKLWSARMQTAWDELRDALQEARDV